MNRLLRISLFLLVTGLMITLAVQTGVNAQEQTVTPGPEQPTLIPACQLYHLTVDEGVVRSCAAANCRVMGSVDDTTTLCIRGIADNADWLLIDLTPEVPDSPLYYINTSIVASGPPGQEEPAECTPWMVGAEEAVVRQCPSITCSVLGGLPPETWLCARGYGGQYEEWVNMDYSEVSDEGGWIHESALRPASSTETITVNTPAPVEPTNTQLPNEAASAPAVAAGTSPTATVASTTQPLLPPPTRTATPPLPICPTESAAAGVNPFDANALLATATLPPTATHTAIPSSQEFSFVDEFPYMMLHNVERGETLGTIANRFGSSVSAIREANELSSNSVILVGQELMIPVSEEPTENLPMPTTAPATETPIVVDPLLNCVTATPTPLLAVQPQELAGGPLLAHDATLANMEIDNMELVSPQGSTQFQITLPANWQTAGNNILYLNTEYFESGSPALVNGTESNLTSLLNIYMDDELISSITFTADNVGEQTLAIPLPANLMTESTDPSHYFQLSLQAEDHCLADTESHIFIRSDQSYIHFEYFEYLPLLDLAKFPQPFYNDTVGVEQEVVILVLPSTPSIEHLKAAAGITASINNLTYGDIDIRVTTADELTEADRQANNLILIGESGSNLLIDALYNAGVLLTDREADGEITFNGQSVADDGIVQLITHPENRLRAIGVVTGQSPEAFRKAAQAVSGPPSIMGLGGPLALITDTRPPFAPPTNLTLTQHVTFEELGYDNITVNGIGLQVANIRFELPTGVALQDNAYIDLLFNYSDVLGGNSSVTFLMNNMPLSSFSLETINNTTVERAYELDNSGRYHVRVPIPASSVKAGRNTLSLVVDVEDRNWDCNYPDPLVTWFTAWQESSLMLPHQTTGLATMAPVVGWFPSPFNMQSDLSNVLISLPSEPTTMDYTQAIAIIARLGASTNNTEAFTPVISVGELPDDLNLADYHFIVIGRPTTNPFLAELNNNLPQPFIPDTDELQQTLDDVSYRMPPGYDVGVLQILRSPWSQERFILAITGTGETGQNYAANALGDEIYGQSELQGDIVFVSPNAVWPVDTREIEESIDILTALPDLSTETALNAMATEVPVVAVTVTDGPTATPTITYTPSMIPTITPIFTPTIAPTQPTPIPTFPPLSPETMQPVEVIQPSWMNALFAITGIALLIAIVIGLIQLLRGRNQR